MKEWLPGIVARMPVRIRVKLLGALLIGIALAAADRLGRSIISPVAELGEAAEALSEGDLDVRVTPAGPPEIVEVARAFNELAERLDDLLQEEREAAADLSHGLRTPLMALRLQIESLPDGGERDGLLDDVARVEAAVDQVIVDARSRTSSAPRHADLAAVTRARTDFWEPLAQEQGRAMAIEIPARSNPVKATTDDLVTVVDTLIENVFAHTQPGTPIRVVVMGPELVVEDGGPGFGDHDRGRGVSGAGSTGLGLDIVDRIARRSGGETERGTSSLGGARVTVRFGPAA